MQTHRLLGVCRDELSACQEREQQLAEELTIKSTVHETVDQQLHDAQRQLKAVSQHAASQSLARNAALDMTPSQLGQALGQAVLESEVADALTQARNKIVGLEQTSASLVQELELMTNANNELQGAIRKQAAAVTDAQGKVTELESEQSGCKDTIRQQRSKIASLRLEVGTWQQKAAKLKWQGPGSGEDHCHHTSHGSSVNDPAITYEFCISASSCRLFGDS